MKTRNFVMVCIAMLTIGTVQAEAQGLGRLAEEKGKKHWRRSTVHLEQRPTTTCKTRRLQPCRHVAPISHYPMAAHWRNPIPQDVDLQLVGVYGKSTSLNYGTVQLVFKVKMIANKSSVRFGVNSSYPGLMIDQDGNTYKTQDGAGWYDYPVTEGDI